MSSGRDLRQMCRCSSGFEFERSPKYADGTGGGEKCVCDCVSACAPFARVRFRVFGEQIKPLEPQDKSDRRNEEEKEEEEKVEEETGRIGEELGTCTVWRRKRMGRGARSIL